MAPAYSEPYYEYYLPPDLPCPETERPTPPPQEVLSAPHCNSTFDTVICWPATPLDKQARAPCPAHFDGFPLNSNGHALKRCSVNGTWEPADYSPCFVETPQAQAAQNELHNLAQRIIYNVGFTVSTAALIIALVIFFYFRTLRCLRNMIHCQLMLSLLFKNGFWLLMHYLLPVLSLQHDNITLQWVCKLVVAAYNYLNCASYFWMLVEGLYLHAMVVYAFSVDRLRIWMCAILGWGVPLLVLLCWAVIKYLKNNIVCWLPGSYWDLVIHGPILLTLLANLLCLFSTIYIVFTKLRASNTPQSRNFWQTLKGTLVLMPLLGIIYIVMIVPPGDNPVAILTFHYFNAFAHSTQGLLVAVFYCFLNREVRLVVQNRFLRLRDRRSVANNRLYRGESLSFTPHKRPSLKLHASPSKKQRPGRAGSFVFELTTARRNKGSNASGTTCISSAGAMEVTSLQALNGVPRTIEECSEHSDMCWAGPREEERGEAEGHQSCFCNVGEKQECAGTHCKCNNNKNGASKQSRIAMDEQSASKPEVSGSTVLKTVTAVNQANEHSKHTQFSARADRTNITNGSDVCVIQIKHEKRCHCQQTQ